MKYFTCLAILITCNPVSAQKTRQGWEIVTDQNKSCQYAVRLGARYRARRRLELRG